MFFVALLNFLDVPEKLYDLGFPWGVVYTLDSDDQGKDQHGAGHPLETGPSPIRSICSIRSRGYSHLSAILGSRALDAAQSRYRSLHSPFWPNSENSIFRS